MIPWGAPPLYKQYEESAENPAEHNTVSKLPFLPFLKDSTNGIIFNVVLLLFFSVNLGKDFLSKCNLEYRMDSSYYCFKSSAVYEVTERESHAHLSRCSVHRCHNTVNF